jgi:hypothetical protein
VILDLLGGHTVLRQVDRGVGTPRSAVSELEGLLDSPEVASLVDALQETRWTGRPGYALRAMVGMALVKSLYTLPTWTRTVALVREHRGLQDVLGCCPSVYSCYRFATKLRTYPDLLDGCIARVLASLKAAKPGMGQHIAIDGSDLPAYANGQRFVSRGGRERGVDEYSDPDASWGHRSSVSRARAAATPATRSMLPSAPRPAYPSPGPWRPLAPTSFRSCPACSTR